MLIDFEDRASDAAVVERVWRSRSAHGGQFHSMATCNWVIVVTHLEGKVFLTIRGPETRASIADCPANGEWVGIHFRLGTFMPSMSNLGLRDRNDVTLPCTSSRTFQLEGSRWEYPSFENADEFVRRLVRRGMIAVDPRVESVLEGRPGQSSERTDQRHFLRATGMTRAAARQIGRARRAAYLLRGGAAAMQVVHDLGYFDQAHLTRSLRRFVGQTPLQVARGEGQLSLLYNPDTT